MARCSGRTLHQCLRPRRRRGNRMSRKFICIVFASVVALSAVALAQYQPWNNSGGGFAAASAPRSGPAAPAPRRDLTGIWDAGGGGIAGPGHTSTPLTPYGLELLKAIKPGNGPRGAPIAEINDPLSTLGDPAGFPRI